MGKDITPIEDRNEKEPYDTFENLKTILVFTLLGISVALLISDFFYKPRFKDLESRVEVLETKVNDLTASVDVLNLCPLCGSDVKILTVDDSYYIKCPNCNLHTKYFDYKSKLVEYWNGDYTDD